MTIVRVSRAAPARTSVTARSPAVEDAQDDELAARLWSLSETLVA